MEDLVKKRNVAFERLRRIHASVKQLAEREPPAFEVHDRLRKLADMEESFDRIQAEIEEEVPAEELSSVLSVRSDYEQLFYITKGMITKLLQIPDDHSIGANSEKTVVEPKSELKEAVRVLLETQRTLLSSQATASSNMEELAEQLRQQKTEPLDTQLPSYNLPVFRGDRKQWASFRDLFVSSVNNKNLTSALKLQILMSHLEGDAKSLVSSYSITDANYTQVWDTLVEHFDKPKFTVAALVQEFCDQPAVKGSNLASLRKLVSTSDEVIRQLSALGPNFETRDPWLNYIVLKKLDEGLRSQWSQHIVDNDDPTFDDLLKFLKRKCEALETCAAFGGKPLDYGKKDFQRDDRKQNVIKKEIKSFNAVQQQSCPICAASHRIYECTVFKKATINERRERVQQAKLCFNCLRPNHCVKSCPSKSVCRTPNCQQRHHTMLCRASCESPAIAPQEKQVLFSPAQKPDSAAVEIKPALSCTTNVNNKSSSVVIGLLPTALVRVKGNNGQWNEVRVMIDSGSQASLITEHCVTSIGLQRSNANLIVTGIASCSSETTRGAVELEISSRFCYNPVVRVKAYVLSKLPRIVPNQRLDRERLKCLEPLQLADPDFDKPGQVDLILGADVFLAILEDGKVKDETGLPVAINSSFGWIVAGQVFDASEVNCNTAIISLSMDMDIDKALRKFWEVEEVNRPKPLTQEEQQAVDFFNSTHQRDEHGRFNVRLPFVEGKPPLGESLPHAVQRLKAMERRFARDPDFKQLYGDFMAEYLSLGHMERVPDDEVNIEPEKRFYLPHHGVMRQDSVTTKLRVVFDGSCQSSSGISLNEKLLIGPKVTEDLPIVLTRFRSYAFAFMADAEKMYRQVRIHRDDVDYQRIVWRTDPDKPIEHYRLLTVTYGTSCAPFLAIESLRQAARDSCAQYPIASGRVQKNFYVDDFLSGAATLEEALTLKKDIVRITSEAGFHLRKWSANDPRLLEENASAADTSVPVHLHPDADSVKALGIHWYPATDSFGYQLNFNFDKPNTKRQLLSDSARLFDPLGWISPIIVRIKILYQTLWLQDLQWDDPLPAAVNQEWNKIKQSLAAIEDIRIPRWIANHHGALQLHGFADASEAAYAAVVYARTVDDEGNVCISLVASKTKVVPIQQVSLPRLELNAAVLLVELMKQILEAMDNLDVTCYAWTDSTVVLGWLTSHPKKWKTFVANRTSAILDFLPRSSWNHISSGENPADCASRGLLPTELVDHQLWWTGPSLLHDHEDIWKVRAEAVQYEEDTTEQRKVAAAASVAVKPLSDYEIEECLLKRNTSLKFSQREVAWINRFKVNFPSNTASHIIV